MRNELFFWSFGRVGKEKESPRETEEITSPQSSSLTSELPSEQQLETLRH